MPEHRGHGYAYDLLVEATHMLADEGADRIVAATGQRPPRPTAYLPLPPRVHELDIDKLRGSERYVGRTHPLTPVQQRELVPALAQGIPRRRGGVDHPWPQPPPAGWSGHFQKAQPLPYIQVEPTVVAEVQADTAMDRHRWRHPVHYRRLRTDMSPQDVPLLVRE